MDLSFNKAIYSRRSEGQHGGCDNYCIFNRNIDDCSKVICSGEDREDKITVKFIVVDRDYVKVYYGDKHTELSKKMIKLTDDSMELGAGMGLVPTEVSKNKDKCKECAIFLARTSNLKSDDCLFSSWCDETIRRDGVRINFKIGVRNTEYVREPKRPNVEDT